MEQPIARFLEFLYVHLQTVPFIDSIGAYGVAIIILTILIRLVLAPLQQFQLITQRKTMVEQRKLAPEVAELRKKYKKDAVKMNQELTKLYQEHGVNPLGGLVGCLPLIVQLPILTALYYVFQGFAKSAHSAAPFLFIQNLNDAPMHHAVVVAGLLPVPALAYLVFPVLAALTTLVQSRMLQMPPPPNPTDAEQQTQSMQRTMVWLSPVMIGYFALQVPAGLGLYWFVGNLVSIIQQSFVVGWGNVLPKRNETVLGAVGVGRLGEARLGDARGGAGPKNGPGSGPKPGAGPKPRRPRR